MFVSTNTISATRNYFYKNTKAHFSDNECKVMFDAILMKRLAWSTTDLILNVNNRLSESDLLFVRNIVHRLLNNEPFQYILGDSEFYGLTIACDHRALIPRPETEELVAWILEDKLEISSLLDIGTGSGCIALACKSKMQNCHVVGIDCSDEAIALALLNSATLQLAVSWLTFDIFSADLALLKNEKGWDCIVSNPPYIPEGESSLMAKHVVDFEPKIALFVPDESPLLFYQRIIDMALLLLNDKGFLFFEIHEEFAIEIQGLLESKGFINIELRKDLQGKHRMVKAKKTTFNV